jgi:hypothetical protein
LAKPTGKGKRDMKKVDRLDKVLLIKVTLPPFDKYIIFHPAKWCSIFSVMSSQIDLVLSKAPNRRPKYFIGKGETLQPKMLAVSST